MAAKSMKELVAYAKKRGQEHHKYKKGGWSWTTGIECHGFTGRVYGDCGYTGIYNRVHKKGFYKYATKEAYLGKWLVKKRLSGLLPSDLKPGDILYTGRATHHTAIYIGDGLVAEAGGKCTKIAKLNKRASKFKYAFRIPEPKNTPKKKETPKKKATPKKTTPKKTTPKKTTPKKKKATKKLAQEVMDGKWGNYPERKKKLEAAGYNYEEVRALVNEMVEKK